MVILDQSQEGETIPKDVWGTVERIKGDRGVFLRAKIIVCSLPEFVSGPAQWQILDCKNTRAVAGNSKFKL